MPIFAIEENSNPNTNSNNLTEITKTKISLKEKIKQKFQKNKTKPQKQAKKHKQSKTQKSQKLTKNKAGIQEIVLPRVITRKEIFKNEPHKLSVMTIDECVNYALLNNPNLKISLERIAASKAAVSQNRANYAPRLTARVSYNHNDNNGTRIVNSHENSLGFNVGISEMIWDFGKTTARINMAKFDVESAIYDYQWEELNIIYNVRINYYKVLSALANLDIYEQNVRINSLNYDRTKAMFDEGLKSKIDVVNAQVNLTDAKIQLVEGKNALEQAVLALKNSMYYVDDSHFIVKNTENFNFLKADYGKKIESLTNIKEGATVKKTSDGLVMLSSGIEHKDIIQNFEFKPFVMTRKEAVEEALDLRPDLKSNRMLVKVQDESLTAIKKQYAPEITGDITWGYTKNEKTYSSPLQMGASIGLGSINPYKIKYEIDEGENYLDIAINNLNIAKTDIFWEVQQNFVNMRQLEKKIPLMNTKVKATLENFELADGRYSVGLNNYVELQDALANYNNSQLNFVEAVFNYNVARETLLKSMGVK